MNTKTPPRPLTAAEVGACIRQFRQLRHWSQVQLAEISGLSASPDCSKSMAWCCSISG